MDDAGFRHGRLLGAPTRPHARAACGDGVPACQGRRPGTTCLYASRGSRRGVRIVEYPVRGDQTPGRRTASGARYFRQRRGSGTFHVAASRNPAGEPGPRRIGGNPPIVYSVPLTVMSTGIGTDSQKPFAIVIIGGLASRLLLSIFLSPILYSLVAREDDVLKV